MSIGTSKLAGMPLEQRNKLENSAKLLLLWVAASDGKLEESELEFVSSQFPDTKATITTDDFLAVIRNSNLVAIEKAIRTVASESREMRIAFLDTAIALSMADRDIAIAENHILRFYADGLYLGLGMLQKRFQAISGQAFPKPGDPGSRLWWESASLNKSEAENGDDDPLDQPGSEPPQGSDMTFAGARMVLGVSLNASQADIDQAYEKLAAIFQVERVEAMGEAAVSVANSRFRKIQEAYRLLLGNK